MCLLNLDTINPFYIREDKTIRQFQIPNQKDLTGEIINISEFFIARKTNISLKKTNIYYLLVQMV